MAGRRRPPRAGRPVRIGSAGLAATFLFWRFRYFLRDPPRQVPAAQDAIVAAADGFVVYVKRVEDGQVPVAVKGRRRIPLVEYCGADGAPSGCLVGIYMTELSVHRNRVPVSGTVVLREHRPPGPQSWSMGRMAVNLMFDRRPYDQGCAHPFSNERLTIGIRHGSGAVVLVTQIADLWIRRIVARVAVGDRVQRGQQYGLIRFGSQCDVFLPDRLLRSVEVVPGQYVLAGETVIARLRVRAEEAGT